MSKNLELKLDHKYCVINIPVNNRNVYALNTKKGRNLNMKKHNWLCKFISILIAVLFLSNIGSLNIRAAEVKPDIINIKKYSITYHANNGTLEANQIEYYASGTEVTAKPANTFTKPVLKFFGGWSLTADGDAVYEAGEVFTMPSKNINLYAVWNTRILQITYIVTYHANNGMAEADIVAGGYPAGNTVTVKQGSIFTAPFLKVFSGWSLSADGAVAYTAGQTFSMPANNLDLYAIWTKISLSRFFSVTYIANNGTAEPNVTDGGITAGQSVIARLGGTFTAPAAKEFAGWSLTADGAVLYYSGETFTMSPQNLQLYAIWSGKPVLNRGDHNAYMQGYPDGSFGSLRNMTRAEAVVMFSRLLTEQMDLETAYTSTYTDVLPDKWYANAIGYMQQHDVLSDTETVFRPDEPITRAEFADLAVSFENLTIGAINDFSDVPPEYWAYDSINYAVERGWLKGYPDGTFRPDDYIIRAEVVTVTNRVLERYADLIFIEAHTDIIKSYTDLEKSYWAYGNIMEASMGHFYTKLGLVETWTSLK